MSILCGLFGHDWKEWTEYSYQEYLGHHPNVHCRRCGAVKNTKTGEVSE